jgi:hypothetical protein
MTMELLMFEGEFAEMFENGMLGEEYSYQGSSSDADSDITRDDGEELIDGIDRVSFHFHSNHNGRIILFEEDPVANIVNITFFYGISIFEANHNEMSIVVTPEKIKENREMYMLYTMAQLVTENSKKIYWSKEMECWSIRGIKMWKGIRMSNAIRDITYIYGDEWNELREDQEAIDQIFGYIANVFGGLEQIERLFRIVFENCISQLEQEADNISQDIKNTYLYRMGVEMFKKKIEKSGFNVTDDITSLLWNAF